MRTIQYQLIADTLRDRYTGADGVAGVAGRLLPSEAELSREFAASRVTVRRALELLREEGLVDARQGFGWFIAGTPLRQTLARLGTIEGQMAAEGMKPERRILEFTFEAADLRRREVLGTDQVLRVRRVNLADGEPFAVVTVWCPADLGQHLSRRDVERSPFYELLPMELAGATQTIAAIAVSPADAVLLGVPAGSPALLCERVTTDVSGKAVLVSEHVFAGHRTEFVVELPHVEPSITPTGMRLVD